MTSSLYTKILTTRPSEFSVIISKYNINKWKFLLLRAYPEPNN